MIEPWVGKVKTGHTIGEFTVIIPIKIVTKPSHIKVLKTILLPSLKCYELSHIDY